MSRKFFLVFIITFLLTTSLNVFSQTPVPSISETITWMQKYAGEIIAVSATYKERTSINLVDNWKIYPINQLLSGLREDVNQNWSKVEGCNINFSNEGFQDSLQKFDDVKKSEKEKRFIIRFITFSFADLNPSKVQVKPLTISQKEQNKTIYLLDLTTTYSNTNMFITPNNFEEQRRIGFGRVGKINSFSIGFADQQMATRFSNALRNAIKVCGGKSKEEVKEPF